MKLRINKNRFAPLTTPVVKLAILSSIVAPGYVQAVESQDSHESPAPAAPTAAESTATNESEMEQVNVENIKEKYWARGSEAELGVVQNRTYSKRGKLEFGLLGGVAFSDPFLSIKYYGGDIGYHLSEYISLHFLGWNYSVNPSNALITFETKEGATTNTNFPKYFLGTELAASMLYGKLSVLGQSIIYYDLNLLGGVGLTHTESGSYVTPSLGVGQRFYLSKIASLRIDYRLQYYRETILEKVVTKILGQPQGTRDNFNNTISIGLSFMFGGSESEPVYEPSHETGPSPSTSTEKGHESGG